MKIQSFVSLFVLVSLTTAAMADQFGFPCVKNQPDCRTLGQARRKIETLGYQKVYIGENDSRCNQRYVMEEYGNTGRCVNTSFTITAGYYYCDSAGTPCYRYTCGNRMMRADDGQQVAVQATVAQTTTQSSVDWGGWVDRGLNLFGTLASFRQNSYGGYGGGYQQPYYPQPRERIIEIERPAQAQPINITVGGSSSYASTGPVNLRVQTPTAPAAPVVCPPKVKPPVVCKPPVVVPPAYCPPVIVADISHLPGQPVFDANGNIVVAGNSSIQQAAKAPAQNTALLASTNPASSGIGHATVTPVVDDVVRTQAKALVKTNPAMVPPMVAKPTSTPIVVASVKPVAPTVAPREVVSPVQKVATAKVSPEAPAPAAPRAQPQVAQRPVASPAPQRVAPAPRPVQIPVVRPMAQPAPQRIAPPAPRQQPVAQRFVAPPAPRPVQMPAPRPAPVQFRAPAQMAPRAPQGRAKVSH